MEEKYTQFDYLLHDCGGSTDRNIGDVNVKGSVQEKEQEHQQEQEGFCEVKKDVGDH